LCNYSEAIFAFDKKDFQDMQGKMCENFNEPIKAMLGHNLDSCLDDAIDTDGRGHFLSSYDNEEIELGDDLYAYRLN
jgi:hypothetical protein